MSADRQRLTSAIRRIAKPDPEMRGILDEADNKGSKPGSAGVGSSSEAKQARVCCDGSTSDNANPGTGERDPDSGGQAGGLDSTDPAKLDMGEGTLSGVTDCATGEPICFDGGGFVPPDGWEDGRPVLPGWEVGKYWIYGVGSSLPSEWSGTALNCQEARSGLISGLGCEPSGLPDCPNNVSGGFRCEPDSPIIEGGYIKVDCADRPSPEMCSYTLDNPPLAESWPTDGCVNLAVKGGTIVGSKYDPENDGSYSAPRDSIDLCSGGDQISLAPAANGGFKTINPTTDNGYLYNNKNERIAHIDGNEYSDPTI